MNTVLWIVQGLLAAAFLMAGSNKLMRTKEQLQPMMGWVEDFSPGALRVIGALEVLGALGLILPAVTGILPVLTPVAALGLVLTMLGAAATHVRRGEYPMIGINAVLMLLAVFIAYGRFIVTPLS